LGDAVTGEDQCSVECILQLRREHRHQSPGSIGNESDR